MRITPISTHALNAAMKHVLASALLLLAASASMAADNTIVLTIENHVFSPKEVAVPAGKKFALKVVNKDATPAEFESHSLSREKIVPGNSSVTIRMGPLKPGRYDFVEEFHETEAGAQGTVVAK